MKMETDIVSPRDGTIASVNTTKGSSVNAGDTLVSLD
jgi:biotin carboxyl carrier protein